MINKAKDQILSMLIEHSRIIYSVISDMGVFYTGWEENYEKNKENLEKKKNKMQLTEEDGDAIKIRVIQEFAETSAQGLGDYVALILRMDNVINSALEFVDVIKYLDHKLNDEIKKRYRKFINLIIKMADALKTTIKNLRDNQSEVLKNTTMIHEIENEVDLMYREFTNHLYNDTSIDIRVLLRIRDSIKILEELGDKVHDIADIIRILLYS